MILVRSPLRITLGGGGTDLPSYYRTHGGFVVSAAITKYVYVAATKPLIPGIYLKHAVVEEAHSIETVAHPIVRECLRELSIDNVALTTFADIPGGTGLGSSGAFTTALLKALHVYVGKPITRERLASLACEVEIDRCGLVGGKQDQYTAAYGGVNGMTFHPDDTVSVVPVAAADSTWGDLEDNLVLFYTGQTHDSSAIQSTPSSDEDLEVTALLGCLSVQALIYGGSRGFANNLNSQWEDKKKRLPQSTPANIDAMREVLLSKGALGVKLVGAGGGGFLLAYGVAPDALNTPSVRVTFNLDGTKVVTE